MLKTRNKPCTTTLPISLKKNIPITFIIFLIIIGCSENTKKVTEIDAPKIEIYLPKERIKSKDGSELTQEWNFTESAKKDTSWVRLNKYYHKYARYDTIDHNYIYAGSFTATKADLQSEPFIKSNEILQFDFKNSKIKISSSGVEKIWNLEPNFNFSRQFVITADKKPLLTGYFYSSFSSSYVSHYYIIYEGSYDTESFPKKYKEREFEIFYSNKTQKEFLTNDRYDFKTNSDFYNAFVESGKIVK